MLEVAVNLSRESDVLAMAKVAKYLNCTTISRLYIDNIDHSKGDSIVHLSQPGDRKGVKGFCVRVQV